MIFRFDRITVGICNCFLLRGERTILVDAGALGGLPAFVKKMKGLDFPVEVMQKEIENFK
jgi:hypothetical protein